MTPIRINRVPVLHRSRLSAAAVMAAVVAFPARADDSVPGWQVDVYYPVGSLVSYQGRQYQALVSQIDFRDSDWSPAVATLWKELGTQAGFNFHARWFTRVSNTESHCAMAWSDTTIYTTGGVASVDGVNYVANWWTQGQPPATNNGTGHTRPWTVVGTCAAARSQGATAESNDTQPAAPGSKNALQAQTEDHTG